MADSGVADATLYFIRHPFRGLKATCHYPHLWGRFSSKTNCTEDADCCLGYAVFGPKGRPSLAQG
jgi:hypothetical protein